MLLAQKKTEETKQALAIAYQTAAHIEDKGPQVGWLGGERRLVDGVGWGGVGSLAGGRWHGGKGGRAVGRQCADAGAGADVPSR